MLTCRQAAKTDGSLQAIRFQLIQILLQAADRERNAGFLNRICQLFRNIVYYKCICLQCKGSLTQRLDFQCKSHLIVVIEDLHALRQISSDIYRHRLRLGCARDIQLRNVDAGNPVHIRFQAGQPDLIRIHVHAGIAITRRHSIDSLNLRGNRNTLHSHHRNRHLHKASQLNHRVLVAAQVQELSIAVIELQFRLQGCRLIQIAGIHIHNRTANQMRHRFRCAHRYRLRICRNIANGVTGSGLARHVCRNRNCHIRQTLQFHLDTSRPKINITVGNFSRHTGYCHRNLCILIHILKIRNRLEIISGNAGRRLPVHRHSDCRRLLAYDLHRKPPLRDQFLVLKFHRNPGDRISRDRIAVGYDRKPDKESEGQGKQLQRPVIHQLFFHASATPSNVQAHGPASAPAPSVPSDSPAAALPSAPVAAHLRKPPKRVRSPLKR